MYRPETLTKINKIFDSNVFSVLLNGCKNYMKNKNNNNNNYMIDINFEMICMEVTSFIHDNTINCRHPFELFLWTQDQINYPIGLNGFYKEKHPTIIQCFSDWYIFDPNTKHIYKFPSFIECYIAWIRALYEMDEKNLLIFTLKKNGLVKMYENIYNTESKSDKMDMEFLPPHYKE
jgi:hypothetical protein